MITAVFSSIFLEMNTMKMTNGNKIIMGHSGNKYICFKLILNIVRIVLLFCIFALVIVAGIPLIGGMETENSIVLKMLLGTVFLVVSYCFLFLLMV